MRVKVELTTEQIATLIVTVDDSATEKEIREAALAALDESGGAEWETITWTCYWEPTSEG